MDSAEDWENAVDDVIEGKDTAKDTMFANEDAYDSDEERKKKDAAEKVRKEEEQKE